MGEKREMGGREGGREGVRGERKDCAWDTVLVQNELSQLLTHLGQSDCRVDGHTSSLLHLVEVTERQRGWS